MQRPIPARSGYRKLGFEQESVKKEAFLVDGSYRDLIILGKVFSW